MPTWTVRNKYRRKCPEVKGEERVQFWSIRPEKQLDTRHNGRETWAQGYGLMEWEDRWKRFTGKGSSFTVTFWNFPGTLQTGQQVSKAEE